MVSASLASPVASLIQGGRHGELGFSGVEIATAHPRTAPMPAPLPELDGAGPVEALERPILDALVRGPVVVPFSGGRDSSAMLALASRVARREGLAPPVAATHRFPGVAGTQEDEWQELVIRHLRIDDWEILRMGDALDVVGPVARAAVARHGPLYPPNAHFIVPFAELARGGTVLTGLDGDKVFGGWRWNPLGAIALGAARPTPRNVLSAGLFLSPRAVQRQVARGRDERFFTWLAPDVERSVVSEWAHDVAAQPRVFDRWLDWARRRPAVVTMCRQLDLLFGDTAATVAHPFLDPHFLAAYAARGGRRGFGGRTEAMGALFGDLLPAALVARSTKTGFDRVFVGPHTREVIARWDGTGCSPDLIRADVLREHWGGAAISFRTAMLLQWLWLRQQAHA
jgi:asparagine synthetase B (glutamine-hydrolysing)